MKTYTASTNISVSIVLRNGMSKRISFSPMTDGRSVFYTSDQEIQWGLEHHYKFGKLFTLDVQPKIEQPKTVKKSDKRHAKGKSRASRKAEAPAVEIPEELHDDALAETAVDNESPEADDSGIDDTVDSETDEVDDLADEITVVSVSDPDEAKDYLADKFGISRTKLKTCEIIEATARDFGLTFNYD